ncbi:Gfo/Idh/MocA family oxidoreductase [Deltaproteobacteria bacterium TL4]
MRVIVVGLGVQGYKRRLHAGTDYVTCVDPVNKEAEYRNLEEVPLEIYDAVLACVPDDPKMTLLRYCLNHKKQVLVEKPLWSARDEEILELEKLAHAQGVVCYTAYNHRFEPHFVRMGDLIASGELGRIYSCRMFYGNGTARLVRESVWRDQGAGVLPDLGSHLLDTCRFWFGNELGLFRLASAHRFENQAPDHVIISSEDHAPRIELEMTLCMWRNHFTCDILAEKGTAHIESLCKWGPSIFTHRTRILPSGRPTENQITLVQPDPTWASEYQHFKQLVEMKAKTDLSHDFWLQTNLRRLGAGV